MPRLLPLAALLAAAAVAVAACGSASEPGWTYAPATPSPSASAAPSEGASAAPSEAPSGEPSEEPAGDVITITAVNIAFTQTEVQVPAGTPFTIRFENNDAGVPHNVEIKDAGNQSVFMGEIFNGVGTRDYSVPALPAGRYTFVCTVHPNMTGTLTAG